MLREIVLATLPEMASEIAEPAIDRVTLEEPALEIDSAIKVVRAERLIWPAQLGVASARASSAAEATIPPRDAFLKDSMSVSLPT